MILGLLDLATAAFMQLRCRGKLSWTFFFEGTNWGDNVTGGFLFRLQSEADTWDVASGIRDVGPGSGATSHLFLWPPQLTRSFSSQVTHTITLQRPSCGKASLPPRRRTEVLENRRFGFAD